MSFLCTWWKKVLFRWVLRIFLFFSKMWMHEHGPAHKSMQWLVKCHINLLWLIGVIVFLPIWIVDIKVSIGNDNHHGIGIVTVTGDIVHLVVKKLTGCLNSSWTVWGGICFNGTQIQKALGNLAVIIWYAWKSITCPKMYGVNCLYSVS